MSHWHVQVLSRGAVVDKVCTDDLGPVLAEAAQTEGLFQINALAQSRQVGGTNCKPCRRVENTAVNR